MGAYSVAFVFSFLLLHCCASACSVPSFSPCGSGTVTWTKVREGRTKLRTAISNAEAAGVPTDQHEKRSLWVAEKFLDEWISIDRDQTSFMGQQARKLWYFHDSHSPAQATQWAEDNWRQELTQTCQVLEEALTRLRQTCRNHSSRQERVQAAEHRRVIHESSTPPVLNRETGFYEAAGKPKFMFDFNFTPQAPETPSNMKGFSSFSISLQHLSSDTKVSSGPLRTFENLIRAASARGELVFLHLRHMDLPSFVARGTPRYRRLSSGKRHFINYDIDNPEIRAWWKVLLRAFAKKCHETEGCSHIYSLWNEAHAQIADNDWDPLIHCPQSPASKCEGANNFSQDTKQYFRRWARDQYDGDVSKLRAIYGASATFSNVQFPPNGAKLVSHDLQGGKLWRDALQFNNNRTTEWFQFLKDQVRAEDPIGQITIKLVGAHLGLNYRTTGIDHEKLFELQEVIGADMKTVTTHGGIGSSVEAPGSPYSYSLFEQNMWLDLARSLQPNKPVIDLEWHALSATTWRHLNLPEHYVRQLLLVGAAKGLSGTISWYWGRNADGTIRNRGGASADDWVGSILSFPKVLDAMQDTAGQLDDNMESVVRMVHGKKPIRLFYDEATAMQDPTYMPTRAKNHGSWGSLYLSLITGVRGGPETGVPVQLVTANSLAGMVRQNDFDVPIIFAHSAFAGQYSYNKAREYADAGGKVYLLGDNWTHWSGGGVVNPASRDLSWAEELPSLRNLLDTVGARFAEDNSLGVRVTSSGLVQVLAGTNEVKDEASMLIANVQNGELPVQLHIPSGVTVQNALTGEDVSANNVNLREFGTLMLTIKGEGSPIVSPCDRSASTQPLASNSKAVVLAASLGAVAGMVAVGIVLFAVVAVRRRKAKLHSELLEPLI